MRAAQGWLELGNPAEALLELDNISSEAKDHLAVLELEFEIFVAQGAWDACRDIAEVITNQDKDAEKRFQQIQAAYDVLHSVAEKFPAESTIPYNLACYTCQLGRLAEARKWLKRAFAAGNVTQLKLMALDDRDLQPLWKGIPLMEP